ncbi:MAG: tetratricopeptide repeat protein [Ignavibacteria bacterium]
METESSISKAFEHIKKAYNFQMRGLYNEAIRNYKLSIEFFPTAEAHTYLGWTYSFMGNLDDAIEECKKAIEIDPEFGNPYNDIGSYLIQQGKLDEAITWLELAIKSKRYEAYHYAHLNLGRVLELKGLWFEALDEYRKAIEIEPKYELAQKLYYRLLGMTN